VPSAPLTHSLAPCFLGKCPPTNAASPITANLQRTAHPSEADHLTPFLLGRYLDYCSEMLSLIGKVAALYAQNTQDAVVLAAVDEIETLTTGLSRKIWQKIMILDQIVVGHQAAAR